MVRFDKPCLKVSGAVEYFREHMLGDYLTQGGASEMTWTGAGAKRLGLEGTCRLPDFEALCQNLDPRTGRRLTVRDKGSARRVCFFAQISPPKDVSIAHLVCGDTRIAGWWHEAVAETLREIEATTATRVRLGGKSEDRTTGEFVAAVVTHDANRALDPQLHTHLCLMNLTYDKAEERWKSVQPSAFYQHQGYFREVCYNALAQRMLAAGYQVEMVRGIGFNLAGFPKELREIFSKRRREILVRAGAGASQDELQTATAESRAEKTDATAAALRDGWKNQAAAYLESATAVIAKGQERMAPCAQDGRTALQSAEAHLFERQSVVDSRLLLREALIASRGLVALGDLKSALEERLATGELIREGDQIAAQATLDAENEFVAWAHRQRNGLPVLGDASAAQTLDDSDQREAVEALLKSQSRGVILQGDAGTGKTTSLKAVVAGIEAAGGHVFGCAPSSGAADALRQELTAEADTLQQLLVNSNLQARLAGRTVIVDEAGLISVREMRDLCRLADKHDYRLLFVGDTKQHTAVEAGDALRCLQRFADIPTIRLTKIHRQRDNRFRRAVAFLAGGDAFSAFRAFQKLGAVHEITDPEKLHATAAADYLAALRDGKSCLVISPVWSEINEFTRVIRVQLKEAGVLGLNERLVRTVHSLKWTREQHRRTENYRAGDVLTFHRAHGSFAQHETIVVKARQGESIIVAKSDGSEQRIIPANVRSFDVGLVREIPIATGDRLLLRANLKAAGLKNGDLVTIAGVTEDGTIRLQDGRVLPPWFRQFSHGYASTSHAAQGKTVDRGILLMGDAGIASGNLKQAYVSNSRFRESQAIYTTDAVAASEAMQRPADRALASELRPPASRRSPWRRFLGFRPFARRGPTAAARAAATA